MRARGWWDPQDLVGAERVPERNEEPSEGFKLAGPRVRAALFTPLTWICP